MMIDQGRVRGAACGVGLALLLGATGQVRAQSQQPARPPAPPHTQAVVTPPATLPPAPAATPAKPANLGAGADPAGGDVVARIGNVNITADDVRAFVGGLAPRDQAALAQDPAKLGQAVRLMLANQLVLREALAKKWEQQPPVAAQLDKLRESAIVELYLQSVSAPPAGFPSEAEIESLYEANKAAFLVPRQFLTAQIFVAAPQGADKDTEEKARRKLDDIQRKLKQPGADFAAIARADSEERDTAERGGELGWLIETQIRPEIRAQIAGLAKNAVSDPVRLDDGWHLMKLIDTKAAATRPLAELHDQLAQRLREERAAANRRAYIGKLVAQTPPSINEIALSKLLGAGGAAPPSR
jgi:peptidylprolyl isomerase